MENIIKAIASKKNIETELPELIPTDDNIFVTGAVIIMNMSNKDFKSAYIYKQLLDWLKWHVEYQTLSYNFKCYSSQHCDSNTQKTDNKYDTLWKKWIKISGIIDVYYKKIKSTRIKKLFLNIKYVVESGKEIHDCMTTTQIPIDNLILYERSFTDVRFVSTLINCLIFPIENISMSSENNSSIDDRNTFEYALSTVLYDENTFEDIDDTPISYDQNTIENIDNARVPRIQNAFEIAFEIVDDTCDSGIQNAFEIMDEIPVTHDQNTMTDITVEKDICVMDSEFKLMNINNDLNAFIYDENSANLKIETHDAETETHDEETETRDAETRDAETATHNAETETLSMDYIPKFPSKKELEHIYSCEIEQRLRSLVKMYGVKFLNKHVQIELITNDDFVHMSFKQQCEYFIKVQTLFTTYVERINKIRNVYTSAVVYINELLFAGETNDDVVSEIMKILDDEC